MCLRVDANGNKDGAGTHVSVSVNLMRGEHDDKLTWPFRGDITIKLVLLMIHRAGLSQEREL